MPIPLYSQLATFLAMSALLIFAKGERNMDIKDLQDDGHSDLRLRKIAESIIGCAL
jgi:hypothetical protein